MKVYRSHEYSSRGSSASTHHLHPTHLPFFSVSLIPLLHSPLFTRTFHLSLLRSCHPIILFLLFSLSFCNFPPWLKWREYGSGSGCLFLFFCRLFVCQVAPQKSLVRFNQNRRIKCILTPLLSIESLCIMHSAGHGFNLRLTHSHEALQVNPWLTPSGDSSLQLFFH